MNDTEREQWVDNDEGLYLMWHGSCIGSKRLFVRKHRQEIDEVISNIVDKGAPTGYLIYGGRR